MRGADRVERLGCGVAAAKASKKPPAQDPVGSPRRRARDAAGRRPVAAGRAAPPSSPTACGRRGRAAAVGTSPVTASSAARVGRSPSGHSSSRHPRPRSQPPARLRRAASIRSSASESERVPNSRSSRAAERPAREVHVGVDEPGQHRRRRRGRSARPRRRGGAILSPAIASRSPRRPHARVDEHDGTVSGHARAPRSA